MPDDKDTVERAKELLVYGPIGLAMYVRDTAPSFLKVFVARGRAEVEQRRRSVGDQLGQAREVGETAAEGGGPQVLRIVSDGVAKVRETAEGALAALGGLTADPAADSPEPGASVRVSEAERDELDAKHSAGDETVVGASAASEPSGAAVGGRSGRAPQGDPGLAIADYDGLSASQVVDRLDGLGPGELEAIRAYELEHRGRATILGKIDQLSRAG